MTFVSFYLDSYLVLTKGNLRHIYRGQGCYSCTFYPADLPAALLSVSSHPSTGKMKPQPTCTLGRASTGFIIEESKAKRKGGHDAIRLG